MAQDQQWLGSSDHLNNNKGDPATEGRPPEYPQAAIACC